MTFESYKAPSQNAHHCIGKAESSFDHFPEDGASKVLYNSIYDDMRGPRAEKHHLGGLALGEIGETLSQIYGVKFPPPRLSEEVRDKLGDAAAFIEINGRQFGFIGSDKPVVVDGEGWRAFIQYTRGSASKVTYFDPESNLELGSTWSKDGTHWRGHWKGYRLPDYVGSLDLERLTWHPVISRGGFGARPIELTNYQEEVLLRKH